LYWGTPKENFDDALECGARKPIWEYSIDKYGLDEAKRIVSKNLKQNI
jgi:hypothetical protein